MHIILPNKTITNFKRNRKEVNNMKLLKIIMKNGATQCAECGAFCQGFKDPRGKILCSDCYRKIWG